MHRFRCLLSLGIVFAAAGVCNHSTYAQKSPSSGAGPATAGASAARLAARLRLGDGLNTWQPTRKQIGVGYAPGQSDSTPGGHVHFVVDRAKLRRYLSKTARYVRRSPQDARVAVAVHNATDEGSAQVPAKIIPGHDGAILDVDAAVDQIQKAIQAVPGTVHIVLPVKTKPAHVRTADLQGVDARVGYFVTHFNPGEVGRTQTVRRAISIIDGSVVKPGGVFSVNQTVGERTKERGFGEGHVFVDGKMEMQVGGGMCQVATTLFNAAMLADLKIAERHAHVRTIPYVDPGRDATVYWGQKDFKIQNNSAAPLFISYKTTRTHAIVSLFGKAVPGRKVRLVSHYRRLGERHYTGVFYRVVYNPGSAPQKDATFYSAYKWTPSLDYSH